MALAPVPSDEEIVALFEAGTLVAELTTYHERDEDGDNLFAARCAALHNSRRIDLVAVVKSEAFTALNPSRFFTAQHVFVAAIPDMESPRRELMELCDLLVEKGGADLAASQPNVAIRIWFAKHPNEAASVVREALDGDELSRKYMTFALQAETMIETSLEIAAQFSDERRLSAIAALGWMDYPDAGIRRSTAEALLCYLDASEPDLTRANALQGILRIAEPLSAPDFISKIIAAAVVTPGDQTLHSLSVVLWSNAKAFRSEDKAEVLNALKLLNPTNKGTLDQLDHALSQMVSGPDEAIALDFLRDLLLAHDISIELFDSLEHKLRNGDPQRLFRLMIEWFLIGKRSLCENIPFLIVEDRPLPNDFTPEDAKLTAKQIIFIFRKALGYLFIKPVVCCSVLVWALRSGNDEAQTGALVHLFDIILVSYGGEASDYLRTIADGDPAYPLVVKALAKQHDHHEKLKSADNLKELVPSEIQRAIANKKSHDEISEAHKNAQRKSVLLNLVTRQVILYGHRTRSYVYGPDGKHKTVDMEMHSFSTSFEMPRGDILDPVGLGHYLLVFRAEKFL